ncbi:hypothetical protein EC988_001694 [Linderina pennispora]|nr:hypothetical protein EC988_001694 [Linderina pennispora]
MFSFFKKLVGDERLEQPVVTQIPEQKAAESEPKLPPITPSSSAKPSPPLPPPPPVSSKFGSMHSVSSSTSLRSQVEAERRVDQRQALNYTDFTQPGHAAGGHWNDPPVVVFKKKPAASSAAISEASSFVAVDQVVLEEEEELPEGREAREEMAQTLLRAALEGIDKEELVPMMRRVAEDAERRLVVMGERLGSVSDALVAGVCRVAVLVERNELARAAVAQREVMQSGSESELKWLLGVKRIIEIKQKVTAQGEE